MAAQAAPVCAANWMVTVLDSGGPAGRSVSLRLDSQGTAHAAYFLEGPTWDASHYELSAPQVVPADTTNGDIGGGVLTVDTGTNTLHYDFWICVTGNETATHLHGPAQSGENGATLLTLPLGTSKVGDWVYPEALESDLIHGRIYVDVHTDIRPVGSIRGQIEPEPTAGSLRYAVHNGTPWTVEAVDSGGLVGGFASLALDPSDQPHICYYDAAAGDLKYAYKSGGVWIQETVDAAGNAGAYCAIALNAAGEPHISYYDASAGHLRHAFRTGGVWQLETVDAGQRVGASTSIAVDASGEPYIAYRGVDEGVLLFAKHGGGLWTIVAVDTVGNTGFATSIALGTSGQAHVAYREAGAGQLRYAHLSGGLWSTEVVDASGVVGRSTAVVIDTTGAPRIAYARGASTNADVFLASKSGPNWTVVEVDTTGDAGQDVTLRLAQLDLPRLCYSRDDQCCYTPEISTNSECTIEDDWHRGPAIHFTAAPNHWPPNGMLNLCRPGDVIALRAVAKDEDYLRQECTDCEGLPRVARFGPYEDPVVYDWSLRPSEHVPAELFQAPGVGKSTVLYQIPLCDWSTFPSIRDTVDLVVRNDTDYYKALDKPLTGTYFVITMTKSCMPSPGSIATTVTVHTGAEWHDESFPVGGPGQCIPQPPVWDEYTPVQVDGDSIAITDVPVLCPEYLTLLSVDPSDFDAVSLLCKEPTDECPEATDFKTAPDALWYRWSLISGKGEFPLGKSGPAVAFRRSRTSTAVVQCEIYDSATEAVDLWTILTHGVSKAHRLKAYVTIGADDWRPVLSMGLFSWGGHSSDMQCAADTAAARYEAAGYEVVREAAGTRAGIEAALRDPCLQAFFIVGHGDPGLVELQGGDGFGAEDLSTPGMQIWQCGGGGQHPFLREIQAIGCNTYSPNWERNTVCGRVRAYDTTRITGGVFSLFMDNLCELAARKPLPLAPHDFTVEGYTP